MTPVEELFQLLWDTPKDKLTWFAIRKQMLEKENKVIMEAHQDGAFHTEWDEATDVLENAQDYYNETFNNKQKMKYQLHIVSDCGKRETYTSGNTVQECIEKLNNYHTFGKYEQDFFAKKGEQKLKEEMESGWYVNI